MPTFQNRLLAVLPPESHLSLRPFLKRRDFQRHELLEQPPRLVQSAIFLEEGVVSVIACPATGLDTEIAMIGREGMVGISVLHGASPSPFRTEVRAGGWGYEIQTSDFLPLLQQVPQLRSRLERYYDWRAIQAAMISVAGRRANLEQNLARVLLMIHDRIDGDTIVATHDDLAHHINVRRSGVTEAIHILEGEHLVRSTRGMLEIIDRPGLETVAGDFYGSAENAWFDMLAKPAPASPAAE